MGRSGRSRARIRRDRHGGGRHRSRDPFDLEPRRLLLQKGDHGRYLRRGGLGPRVDPRARHRSAGQDGDARDPGVGGGHGRRRHPAAGTRSGAAGTPESAHQVDRRGRSSSLASALRSRASPGRTLLRDGEGTGGFGIRPSRPLGDWYRQSLARGSRPRIAVRGAERSSMWPERRAAARPVVPRLARRDDGARRFCAGDRRRTRLVRLAARGVPNPVRVASGRGHLPGCAALDAGVLRSDGTGLTNALTDVRPWLASAALGRLTWSAFANVFIEGGGGVTAQVTRYSFSFREAGVSEPPLHQIPLFAATLDVDAGYRFP